MVRGGGLCPPGLGAVVAVNGVASADKEFGARLKMLRERVGASQRELADRLNRLYGLTWHQTTVGKVETGERPIRLAEALAVAGVLGADICDLLVEPDATAESVTRVPVAEVRAARVSEIEQIERDLARRKCDLGSL